jgi:CBS domain containing-hemolysin-like protein
VSLGGYFQEQLGRVLKAGDELRIQDWRIRVLAMRGMAPRSFLLKPVVPAQEGEEPDHDPGH